MYGRSDFTPHIPLTSGTAHLSFWSGGQVVRWSGGQVVRWSGKYKKMKENNFPLPKPKRRKTLIQSIESLSLDYTQKIN